MVQRKGQQITQTAMAGLGGLMSLAAVGLAVVVTLTGRQGPVGSMGRVTVAAAVRVQVTVEQGERQEPVAVVEVADILRVMGEPVAVAKSEFGPGENNDSKSTRTYIKWVG